MSLERTGRTGYQIGACYRQPDNFRFQYNHLRGFSARDGYIYIYGNGTVTFTNTSNYILSVGKYLRCEGSRPASFGGKVSVDGTTLYNNYAIYFDGTGNVLFSDTIHAGGSCRFGSSRTYTSLTPCIRTATCCWTAVQAV